MREGLAGVMRVMVGDERMVSKTTAVGPQERNGHIHQGVGGSSTSEVKGGKRWRSRNSE